MNSECVIKSLSYMLFRIWSACLFQAVSSREKRDGDLRSAASFADWEIVRSFGVVSKCTCEAALTPYACFPK